MSGRTTLYCSFCCRSHHEVRILISGPTVFICDECTLLCIQLLTEECQLADVLDARKIFGKETVIELQKPNVNSFAELCQLGGLEQTEGPYTALDIFNTTMRGIDTLLLSSTQLRLEKRIAAARILLAKEETQVPTLEILKTEITRLESLRSVPETDPSTTK